MAESARLSGSAPQPESPEINSGCLRSRDVDWHFAAGSEAGASPGCEDAPLGPAKANGAPRDAIPGLKPNCRPGPKDSGENGIVGPAGAKSDGEACCPPRGPIAEVASSAPSSTGLSKLAVVKLALSSLASSKGFSIPQQLLPLQSGRAFRVAPLLTNPASAKGRDQLGVSPRPGA